MSTTRLDEIVHDQADALTGDSFLDLMRQRRLEFWDSKPRSERSHYQGFSSQPEPVIKERLLIQCHAELSAGNIPLAMLEYVPWMDLKADFARQVHDEFVHFKLTRDYYHRHFGEDYPADYQPPFKAWRDLLSLAHSGDYQIAADPTTRVVARSVILQFSIEGWDVEFIHPNFMAEMETNNPEMFEIFESRIIGDEHVHAENGDRVLQRCHRNRDLQKLAIKNLDVAMAQHHLANAGYQEFFQNYEKELRESEALER